MVLGPWAGKGATAGHLSRVEGLQSQFERRTRAWEYLQIGCEYVDGPDPKHFTSQGARTILNTHKARFGRFYNNK